MGSLILAVQGSWRGPRTRWPSLPVAERLGFFFRATILALAVSIWVAAVPDTTSAELQSVQITVPGSGTLDTDTGLTWMDPRVTRGLSWDELCDGAGPAGGWIAQGWEHATAAQLCDFFDELGAVPEFCPGRAGDGTSGNTVANHHAWLSTTLETSDSTEVAGLYGGTCGVAGKLGLGIAQYSVASNESNLMIQDSYVPARIPGDHVGHFLVTVPEPSGVLSLCIGVSFLLALRRAQARHSNQ